MSNPEKEKHQNADDEDGEVDENYNPEEEVVDEKWKANIVLQEVKPETGEENEETISKYRTKFYRWHDKQWKERAVGELKLNQHKTSQLIRAVLRQDKTQKVMANFLIYGEPPICQLAPQKTTDKAWIFTVVDYSDLDPKMEKFCARFTSVEEFNKFKEAFEKAHASNHAIKDKKPVPEPKQEETKEDKASA